MQTSDINYLFYELIENSRDFIYTVNGDGYVTYANNKLLKMLGYSIEEMLKMHYIDFVHPDHKEYVLNFINNVMKLYI